MKYALIFAALVAANAQAFDVVIDGKKVEVDRIEIITKSPLECSAEDATYDFYDIDKDGRFEAYGTEYCYNPCSDLPPEPCTN
jgi:hypothetical protein